MITPEPEANRPPARSDTSKAAWPQFRSRGDSTPSTGRRKICLSLSGGGLSGAFYEIGCLAGHSGIEVLAGKLVVTFAGRVEEAEDGSARGLAAKGVRG